VGSEDFTLYGVELDGSGVKASVRVNTTGAIRGSVAELPGSTKECGFATSDTGFVGVASTVANDSDRIGPTTAFAIGPVIGMDGRIYSATSTGSLRSYALNASPVVTLSDAWSSPVGFGVTVPLAVDLAGDIWSVSIDGKLAKTTPSETSGAVLPIGTLPASPVDSPVILAGGDVVVGDQANVLHRLTPAGLTAWSTEPNLGAAPGAPIVVAGGDAALVVPTAGGKLVALHEDGTEAWSATLDNGKGLRINIYTAPGQTSNVMSTAYVASSSGKLFAVIVDGQLDASAPWPKAFHDPKNTNRAGPQP
jgi:hypothetical protein